MQQKKACSRRPVAGGLCPDCGVQHVFHEGCARACGLDLMRSLEQEHRLDFLTSPGEADPRLDTSALFTEARGKMFGVMPCRSADGSRQVVLRAFSGQYNGIWEVEGWAPPLFNVADFTALYLEIEPQIKAIGRTLRLTAKGSSQQAELATQRRQLSRQWMHDIHALYTLSNFRGRKRLLAAAFTGKNGIPTGTGDCCAPKLFHQAITGNLLPLGLAEFYWGRENASGTRRHGQFYPACTGKCAPILGFMLCGLDELLNKSG